MTHPTDLSARVELTQPIWASCRRVRAVTVRLLHEGQEPKSSDEYRAGMQLIARMTGLSLKAAYRLGGRDLGTILEAYESLVARASAAGLPVVGEAAQ